MSAGVIAASYVADAGSAIEALGADVTFWGSNDAFTGASGTEQTIWENKTGGTDAARIGVGQGPRRITGATPAGGDALDFGVHAGNGFAVNAVSLADPWSGVTEGEFWAVVKAPTPVSGGCSNALFQTGSVASHSHYPYRDGFVYEGGMRSFRTSYSPSLSLASWRVYRVRSGSGIWSAHVDGVEQYSRGAQGGFGGRTTMLIGGVDTNNKAEFNTHMAEVVCVKRLLTTDEAGDVLAELTSRHLTI